MYMAVSLERYIRRPRRRRRRLKSTLKQPYTRPPIHRLPLIRPPPENNYSDDGNRNLKWEISSLFWGFSYLHNYSQMRRPDSRSLLCVSE